MPAILAMASRFGPPFNILWLFILLHVWAYSVKAKFPGPVHYRHNSSRIHHLLRESEIEAYHPPSVYETYGSSIAFSSSYVNFSGSHLKDFATSFLRSKLSVDSSKLSYTSELTSEHGHVAYFAQAHDGTPFANAVAHVAFWKDGRVASFGSSFVKLQQIASPNPTIFIGDVLSTVESLLGATVISNASKLEYLALSDGSAALVYVFEVQNIREAKWFEAFVDAHTGELRSITNFVARASYMSLPIYKASLPEGQRMIVNPEDLVASPLGWHNDGVTATTNTTGNNVQTFKWNDPGYVYTNSSSSQSLVFDYPADLTLPPDAYLNGSYKNLDAARTNAFYVLNVMHDMAWRYGFTEDAFNFQVVNLGGRGANSKANDPVRVSVQAEGNGVNNAFFASPADGTSAICYMLLWTNASPERDGALANDILVHEFTHGITNRMTGGGTSRCLQTLEAMGLGEGWSDVVAEWTELKSAVVDDYTFGAYVAGDQKGLRTYPYSTNTNVNPRKYSDMATMIEPHDIGEIWANILHNLLAILIKERGWSKNAMVDSTGPEGNVVFMHLIIDALPLQPCNPTFVQARDSIIQADAIRYNGINRCLIWKIFASRGLGVKAADYVDNEEVPRDCM